MFQRPHKTFRQACEGEKTREWDDTKKVGLSDSMDLERERVSAIAQETSR